MSSEVVIVTRFPLGRITATRNVAAYVEERDIAAMIAQHATGNWGDLGASDKAANERALVTGGRILSKYHFSGQDFYVITEADRSLTTVLFTSEY